MSSTEPSHTVDEMKIFSFYFIIADLVWYSIFLFNWWAQIPILKLLRYFSVFLLGFEMKLFDFFLEGL